MPASAIDVRSVRDLLEVWIGSQEDRPNLSSHTIHGYRNAGRNIANVIGDAVLERVDPATVYRLRDTRLRAGAASGTVDMELGVFKMAWRWGREMGFCPARDLPRTRVDVKPTRSRHTPSREDIGAVLRVMSGWPRLAVLVLFATGARIGDIASLLWADVDLDDGTLRLGGKTGERTVPLPAHVVDELRRAKESGRSDPRVFGVRPESVKGQLRVRYLPRACKAARNLST